MRFDGQTNRQRITGFKMSRVAAVTRPAQEGALALIAKRRDDDPATAKRKGSPGYDSTKPRTKANAAAGEIEKSSAFLLTTNEAGHAHGLRIWDDENGGETTTVQMIVDGLDASVWHDHPWTIGPDGQILIGEVLGHDHEADQDAVMAALTSFLKAHPEGFQGALFPQMNQNGNISKLMARVKAWETTKGKNMAKPTEKTTDDLATAKAASARWESIAGLTTPHREHFDTLEGDPADAFLAKSETEREVDVSAIATNKAAADPIVYTGEDGTEYRKSDGLVAKFAKRDDVREAEMKKLRTEKADLRFEKAGGTHFEKLAGTDDDHTALMKAIGTIEDEPQRMRIIGAIKGATSKLAKGMNRIGSNATSESTEESDDLDDVMTEKAKAYAKDNDMSVSKAFSELTRNDPEFRKLYREANPDSAAVLD